VSEPAEPLFAEPLFAEPLFAEPLFAEPLLGRVAPEPIAPELAILELIGPHSAPWQPATSQPPLTGLAAPESAAPESAAPESAVPDPTTPAGAATAAGASTQARPQPGRVVSGRGVTGRGVVVLILIPTGLAGLLEVAFAGHRGAAFAVAFVLTSAVGALVVRRRDLPTSIIAPPLLYCVLIAALSLVDTHDQSGGFITRKAVYIGNAFVTGAPTLWAGTAAAVAIAWYRRRATRKPRS
jgi:hypothetical protein